MQYPDSPEWIANISYRCLNIVSMATPSYGRIQYTLCVHYIVNAEFKKKLVWQSECTDWIVIVGLIYIFMYQCLVFRSFPEHVQTSKANFRKYSRNLNSEEIQRHEHGHINWNCVQIFAWSFQYSYLESIKYEILDRVDVTISSDWRTKTNSPEDIKFF